MLNCLLVIPLVVLAELISGCREGVYHYNPVIIVNKTLEHLERGIREFCRSRISSSGTVPWLVGEANQSRHRSELCRWHCRVSWHHLGLR